jgi:hypothetical protein
MKYFDSDLERRVKIKLIVDGKKQVDLAREWGVTRQCVNAAIYQRIRSGRVVDLLHAYVGVSK